MSDPILSLRRKLLLAATAAGLATVLAVPAGTAQAAPKDSRFDQVDVVSDQAGVAALTDPVLKNAWGLALGPTTPLWSANNDTGIATLYAGNGTTTPFNKVALEVTVPGGSPTGQVFNDTAGFPVGTGPARFIFDTQNGDLVGWNPALGTTAQVTADTPGAVYTGLALLKNAAGPQLLAADFSKARIDVFDSSWNPVDVGDAYTDPALQPGYSPFNVAVLGDAVYVAYAKQSEDDPSEEVHGHNLGFVDRYTDGGRTVQRIASRGNLNSPWGMAIAPASFGKYAGSLLVGNFGDGKIGAFTDDGDFLGFLRDADNDVIVIDGLWALLPGTATTGGTNSVWFSSGPADETHGLVGLLRPASTG